MCGHLIFSPKMVVPLEEDVPARAAEAHRMLESSGEVFGKIVLTP
ncbi:hypothetical protein ACFQ1S_26775 [Kibdelosporangium lantanae]|uniref:Zinc-binding dehydrogenase n=1 Tax=Kibdelosporangium lantanae TaxID=1497396 RepID=A0ABW3MFQ0_9PSEU